VTESSWFIENLGRMPVCLFMLLPASATAPGNISQIDPNITYAGQLTVKTEGREFTPSVYKVLDPHTGVR